jgi:adenine-specific DNA-methyltransferase
VKRKNIDKCRSLRKSQTDAEQKIWAILRNRKLTGAKFRRQFSLDRYILDFYCPKYKLGVELDGSTHYDDAGKQKDSQRADVLAKYGVSIIRFSNLDVLKETDSVAEAIYNAIEYKKLPSPLPSPRSGEGQ